MIKTFQIPVHCEGAWLKLLNCCLRRRKSSNLRSNFRLYRPNNFSTSLLEFTATNERVCVFCVFTIWWLRPLSSTFENFRANVNSNFSSGISFFVLSYFYFIFYIVINEISFSQFPADDFFAFSAGQQVAIEHMRLLSHNWFACFTWITSTISRSTNSFTMI